MNKKGFTLIELMVSIAIMLLLASMLIPAINKIRKNTLQSLYESKKERVLSTSLSWGRENLEKIPQYVKNDYITQKSCDVDCGCVLVRELINQGFLAGDSNGKTELKNPVNKQSMNSIMVCVRYNNNDPKTRKLVSYIVEE